MAGDWIKMRGNLWDDPRVSKLCDLTGQGEAAIVGGLYWLWATADQHTEDGCMPGLTLRQIDRKTAVPGFGQALCDIGWLADHPEGVQIVGFEEHNGTSAKRRCTDAQRKANSRGMSADDADKLRTDEGQKAPTLGAREREEKNNTSVAKATGVPPAAKSEDETKRELFDAGKSLLAEQGMPAKQTGSFIGKLAKDYGQAHALEAVRSAVVARPMGAAEYLKATCLRLAGERKEPVTVPSAEAERTAAYLAQQSARVHDPPTDIGERLRAAKQAVAVGGGSLRAVA